KYRIHAHQQGSGGRPSLSPLMGEDPEDQGQRSDGEEAGNESPGFQTRSEQPVGEGHQRIEEGRMSEERLAGVGRTNARPRSEDVAGERHVAGLVEVGGPIQSGVDHLEADMNEQGNREPWPETGTAQRAPGADDARGAASGLLAHQPRPSIPSQFPREGICTNDKTHSPIASVTVRNISQPSR